MQRSLSPPVNLFFDPDMFRAVHISLGVAIHESPASQVELPEHVHDEQPNRTLHFAFDSPTQPQPLSLPLSSFLKKHNFVILKY